MKLKRVSVYYLGTLGSYTVAFNTLTVALPFIRNHQLALCPTHLVS